MRVTGDSGQTTVGPSPLFSRIASGAVILLGVLVLSGWTFGVRHLIQIVPGLVAMNPTTALGFVVAGVCLWRLSSRPAGFGKAESWSDPLFLLLGLALAVLGLLRLADLLGLNWHIHELLFASKLDGSAGYPPSEMAANTALSFVLCGAALALFGVEFRKWLCLDQALVLVAGWIGLLAIIGYTYRVLLFYRLGPGLPMSFDTALGFVLFCAGFLSARPQRGLMRVVTSRTSGGAIARRLLPMAILVPWGLGAILLVFEQAGLFGKEFAISLFAVVSIVLFTLLLWWNAKLVYQVDLERAGAEAQLRQSSANLERSNTDLQQFAYLASHDLFEPLRMVTSYLQLLEQRYGARLDKQGLEFLGFAIGGARRMDALIRDLLEYSRVEIRGSALESADCEQVLQQALANLKIAIEETNAAISHQPLPRVRGDSVQLIQVFQNLVGNAIKFRGPRAPRVEVSAQPKGKEWQFAVRDNGIGIDPKFFERIFVIFQRLHTHQQYAGTGMGLAICKRIIERHGGRIWVESNPGEGSSFFFTLPALG